MNPVEEIKNRLDIIEVISNYITLNQVGTNFRARCPFHNEKTPSFMVSKEKQIWHCFGCDKGGDSISFVQEYEGVEFAEALKILAAKAGIPLSDYRSQVKVDYSYLYEINKLAVEFYQNKLNDESETSKKVLEYLANRNISQASIQTWQLGLSSVEWDELYKYLVNKGFQDEQIFQAGLIVKKKDGSGYVDRFRKRLMFPIYDSQGRAVAFTSRILTGIAYDDEEYGGKYVNSPQTVVYDKSKILYGWHLAKDAIRQKKYLIIVEGNLDAIATHQAGTLNTVAVSGTALTNDHLKLIKRYTNNVILAFDGDQAGSRASFRSVVLGWKSEMNLKILLLPQDKDPADIVKEDAKQWINLVKKSIPVMDYYFHRIVAGVDLSRADHKKIAIEKLLPIIKFLKSKIEQVHYLQLLSTKLQIPLELLQQDLEATKSFLDNQPAPAFKVGQSVKEHKDSILLLTEQLLSIGLYKENYLEKIISEIEPEAVDEALQSLYRKVIIYYTKHQNLTNFKDYSELDNSEQSDWIRLSLLGEKDYSGFSDKDLNKDFNTLIHRLKHHHLNIERQGLIQELRQAEVSNDNVKQDILIHKINIINKEINKLQN